MKRKLNLVMLIFLGFLSIKTSAQKLSEIKPVRVGDKMPDIPLANIFRHENSKGGTLMSEFGGKPLIIDLWFTSCAPCVDAMPFMDSLQKENSGKLNILLSDYAMNRLETVERVKEFLTKNPYLKDVYLPTTIRDSVMGKLFPGGQPCQVWVDEKGIVRSISESGQVTRENVKIFLSGKPLSLNQVKVDNDPYRDPEKYPLMVIDQNFNQGKARKFYSYISGYDSTANRPLYRYAGPTVENNAISMRAINADLFELYNAADRDVVMTENYQPLRPYQFIVNNPQRFRRLHSFQSMYVPDPRDMNKLYCYELRTVDTSSKKAFRIMKHDLDNFFNMESSFEKKMLPCYVVKRINPKADVIKSKGGAHANFKENGYRRLVNEDWSWIFDLYLNQVPSFYIDNDTALYDGHPLYFIPYQVVDETGYAPRHKIDISIPVLSKKWNNLFLINENLKKYNLIVTKEDRELDIIVLKDQVLQN